MKIDLAQFRAAFFEEAIEHQAALESGLLALEREPADREALDRVFRAAHSIKGGSGTFGLTDVARFTHVLEALLDRLRGGQLQVTPAVTEVLLRATDMLREVLAAARAGAPAPEGMEAMMAALAEAQQAGAPTGPAVAPAAGPVAGDRAASSWRVSLVPHVDLLQRGQDPLLLLRELEALGTLSEVVPDLTALPALAHLDPERCYLGWSLRLTGEVSEAQVREVFQFVEDTCDVTVAPVAAATQAAKDGRAGGRPGAASRPPRWSAGRLIAARATAARATAGRAAALKPARSAWPRRRWTS
ncbi:MAG: Hpt domain-containing protein [Gemmatimonadetes bacterium]|nr:Hpt domain-containing protein [Gemmatimonadota bacterium]